MGDKITRPAKAADLLRAKFLKEALQRGTPSLSHPLDPTAVSSTQTLDSDSLEVQKAYLEQLVECTPEAISILDEQYRIVRVNGGFTRMLCFFLYEAFGRSIDSYTLPLHQASRTSSFG